MRVRELVCLLLLTACGAARPDSPPAGHPGPASVASRPVAAPTPAQPPATAPGGLTLEDGTDFQIRMLESARADLVTFVDKAGDAPEYADAVRRARDRIDDITQTIDFLRGQQPR